MDKRAEARPHSPWTQLRLVRANDIRHFGVIWEGRLSVGSELAGFTSAGQQYIFSTVGTQSIEMDSIVTVSGM